MPINVCYHYLPPVITIGFINSNITLDEGDGGELFTVCIGRDIDTVVDFNITVQLVGTDRTGEGKTIVYIMVHLSTLLTFLAQFQVLGTFYKALLLYDP